VDPTFFSGLTSLGSDTQQWEGTVKGPDSSALRDGSHVLALARDLRDVRAATGMSLKQLECITASSDSLLSRYLSSSGVPPAALSTARHLCADYRVLRGVRPEVAR
jgi:hypothetical protein